MIPNASSTIFILALDNACIVIFKMLNIFKHMLLNDFTGTPVKINYISLALIFRYPLFAAPGDPGRDCATTAAGAVWGWLEVLGGGLKCDTQCMLALCLLCCLHSWLEIGQSGFSHS